MERRILRRRARSAAVCRAALVRHRPVHVSGLTSIRFGNDELVPVVAAGHDLAEVLNIVPSDLDNVPLLMREIGSATRQLITDILHELKITKGPVMEFGNTEALKQAAIHGGGVAWLPSVSISSELHSGALVQLASDQLMIRRPLSVIRRRSSPDSPADEAFMRMLMQQDRPAGYRQSMTRESNTTIV